MPIFLNTNKNILFIHPPKTGGEFISEYLSNFGFRSLHSKKGEFGNYIPSQHLHSEEMIKSIEKLGIKKFWDYNNDCEKSLFKIRKSIFL